MQADVTDQETGRRTDQEACGQDGPRGMETNLIERKADKTPIEAGRPTDQQAGRQAGRDRQAETGER